MTTKRSSQRHNPIRNIGLIVIAAACVFIGMLGLILPVIPGFLFLLVAAGLLAQLSPWVRTRLDGHPRMTRFFRRLDAGGALTTADQCKMTLFASLEAITRPIKRS